MSKHKVLNRNRPKAKCYWCKREMRTRKMPGAVIGGKQVYFCPTCADYIAASVKDEEVSENE